MYTSKEVPQNVVHVLMLWYVKRSTPFSGLKGPGDGLVLLLCVQTTFRSFPDKNCGQIFSNVVFLIVTMYGYPAMMPVSQLDFMVPTDISNALWHERQTMSELNLYLSTGTTPQKNWDYRKLGPKNPPRFWWKKTPAVVIGHKALEMSLGTMKSNWETGIMRR